MISFASASHLAGSGGATLHPRTGGLGYKWFQEPGMTRQRASNGPHYVPKEGDMPLQASPRLLLTLQRKVHPPGRGKARPHHHPPFEIESRASEDTGLISRASLTPPSPFAWHLLQTPPSACKSMAQLSIEMLTPVRRNEWEKERLCALRARWRVPDQTEEEE